MRKIVGSIGVVTLLTMVGIPGVSGAAGAPAAKPPQKVDPKAVEVMQKMGDYMAGLQKFKVHTDRVLQVILPNDQKLLSDRAADLSVQRPDRLRASLTSAKRDVEYFYDGKTLTLYSPREKYYSTVEVKPTIAETIEYATAEYDIEFPMVDVFYHHDVLLKQATLGDYVGISLVGGARCHHLAFRQKDMDWEVWIEEGDKPLTRRIAITDKSQKGNPITVITLSNWNVSPTFEPDLFTFTPPQDAQKIKLLSFGGEEKSQGASTGAKPAKK